MTCKARYRGLNPVFGIDKSKTYTLTFGSQACPNGDQYMWVHIKELPQYLMPYESMYALLVEWDFTVDEQTQYVDHLALVDKWLSVYAPVEVSA